MDSLATPPLAQHPAMGWSSRAHLRAGLGATQPCRGTPTDSQLLTASAVVLCPQVGHRISKHFPFAGAALAAGAYDSLRPRNFLVTAALPCDLGALNCACPIDLAKDGRT